MWHVAGVFRKLEDQILSNGFLIELWRKIKKQGFLTCHKEDQNQFLVIGRRNATKPSFYTDFTIVIIFIISEGYRLQIYSWFHTKRMVGGAPPIGMTTTEI